MATLRTPPPKNEKPEVVSISPLLQRLAYPTAADIRVSAEDIASAFALIFEDRLSDIQTAALLTLLHSTRKDKDAAVIAKCSHRMREAACQIEKAPLRKAVKARGRREGNYNGGLVRASSDIQISFFTYSFDLSVRYCWDGWRLTFNLQCLDNLIDHCIAAFDDSQTR